MKKDRKKLIKKVKNERGAITALVLASLLVIAIVLINLYMMGSNKSNSQDKEVKMIEEAYNSDEVIVLNSGEVLLQGKPSEVFANEKLLANIDLDLPFFMKVKNALISEGVDVKDTHNLEELVNKLCQ